jgi:hypothetical protein
MLFEVYYVFISNIHYVYNYIFIAYIHSWSTRRTSLYNPKLNFQNHIIIIKTNKQRNNKIKNNKISFYSLLVSFTL